KLTPAAFRVAQGFAQKAWNDSARRLQPDERPAQPWISLMRSTVFAVAGALALLLLPQAGALAQDDSTTAAPKREAPAARLPKAPIPYAKLRPKPARPKPKPASTAAAATPGATTG